VRNAIVTSKTAPHRGDARRRETLAAVRKAQTRRVRRRNLIVTGVVLAVIAAVVAAMMLTSRPSSSTAAKAAPDFTLTDTAGTAVHLGDLRGHNVVLYFSEGAGCGSCLQQMAAIEQNRAAFTAADVTVLPVVMNTREQIVKDMGSYGVTTPFLLDDGRVAKAYNTLGKGMHAGLPGHSFVLVDKDGVQRWTGEYPSMFLAPSDLLTQVRQHLPA
jgi:peroxiredoxin